MSQPHATRTVTVANCEGVHARAASLVAKLARRFDAEVFLTKGNERVEATEVLQILSLGADRGTDLKLEAKGPEAEAAVDALARLFERGFDEDTVRQFNLQAGNA
jgi:phosphotransferase system HPr (HPr) family protein